MAGKPDTRESGSHSGRSRPGLRSFWFGLRRTLARKRVIWRRFRATRFVLVPPGLQAGDPSIAVDFAHGQIVLAGRSLLTRGANPFTATPPGPAFAEALHSFGWLHHFAASEQPEIRAEAHRLVRQWLDDREAGRLPRAVIEATASRRVIAMLSECALLTETQDFDAYNRVLESLAQDVALIRVMTMPGIAGMHRLEAAISMRIYTMALDVPPRLEREAAMRLDAALAACLDAQGVPRDRCPLTALALCANLIALQALHRARGGQNPAALSRAIQALVAFLRMMQMPDGGLAHLEGGNQADRDLLAEVIGFGNRQQPRLAALSDAGFERIEDEHAVLIADTGVIPAPEFAGSAQAGALSFEFSTKADRLIVNCGLPKGAEGEVLRAYRSAGAHSTLLIDNEGVATLAPEDAGGRLSSAGQAFVPHRATGTSGIALTLGHDGRKAETGYICERRLTMLANGEGLQGLDRVIDAGGEAVPIRITLVFHLHPRVLPVRLSRSDAIVLRLPHQRPGLDLWLFHAPGQMITLEESRVFDGFATQSQTKALVLDIAANGTTDILWSLTPYRGA